jgi:L-ascorbate metabolism protein UlaG (beta-lactamase superfamily)
MWPSTGTHAAWIGHSTVLLSVDGFNVLTDPVLSNRIGIKLGPAVLGFKRLVKAAATRHELPHIDLILLSHAHMDHFDIATLRALENRKTTVITAANTSDLLRVGRYGSVRELKWNESVQVGPVNIKAFQVNHWGARMRTDVHRGYNGYFLDFGNRRIMFGGDTAYTDLFKAIRSSKAIDLALMPIGAYNPWIHAHCTPEQALAMTNDANAELVLPLHHRTFLLSREPLKEPLERLLTAAGSGTDRICLKEIGQEFHLN